MVNYGMERNKNCQFKFPRHITMHSRDHNIKFISHLYKVSKSQIVVTCWEYSKITPKSRHNKIINKKYYSENEGH